MINHTPKEIVEYLDKYIVGQNEAKRAVAIALRNRWRRLNLPQDLREEIVPKNMLMIGATGVGKTEIARRLAKLSGSPFIKVEATKFTEVGYVGRDVEQIIRDLVEISINMLKKIKREENMGKAQNIARNRVVDILAGKSSSSETKNHFFSLLDNEEFLKKEIEIELVDNDVHQKGASFELPGVGQAGIFNLSDILGNSFGSKKKKLKKVSISEAIESISNEEFENSLDNDRLIRDAINLTENSGIVFIDEIDKVCGRSMRGSSSHGEVSREGVQRDLLPIVEGTTVSTKYGPVRTDFILFIASGAFHIAKPSDLLPELQGRFPIRVSLDKLTKDDFIRILKDPEMNLIDQARHLISVEGVDIKFEDDAIEEIASISSHINEDVENIGARRLNTILWKVLSDISFDSPYMKGETIKIDREYVKNKVGEFANDIDISKFIL